MESIPSPNFNERKNGKQPRYIVLHYTETHSRGESLDYLLGKKGRDVSAHYLVDTNGSIVQLVEEPMRAWHAGQGFWQGEEDMNSASIGIEIQNTGCAPYPPQQIETVTALCKEIMQRHSIPPANVIAHSDLAPDRKKDPGELFPWQALAKAGAALWPAVDDDDIDIARTLTDDPETLTTLLTQIGYAAPGAFGNGTPALRDVITAFQRRFEPEVFAIDNGSTVGKASAHTVALMLAVLRQNKPKAA